MVGRRPRDGRRGRRPGAGDLSAGRPLVVAHRGASAVWPEHTAAAYAEAIAARADAVECDVRLSADGHLVCLHDARVERTSQGRGAVSRLTLAQLQQLDYSARHVPARPVPGDPPADPAGLLTLADLIALLLAAPSPIGLLVETKHPVRHGAAVEAAVVAALRPVIDRLPLVAVMSFWPPALRRLRRLAPEITRVALRADRSPAPVWGDPDVVGLAVASVRRDPARVQRTRRGGTGVYVWTVERSADVELCRAAGADAIITDSPREVRAMLWP